ncbi:hypothetical protein PN498_02755 [Oscillatoria sp. CS-180]|uniref:hypothetical protein n=1 Tax=Oscillatoria sp. CS-180 TaxID=3021720 RepID=UPI002330C638|nr:hypothetical protein [Oscillatoria sp. CS-180]MDB9524896.1 hypothetical protein [Oscillatoria sp. CS-180]
MPNNNSLSTAQNLGVLSGAITPISELVGSTDRNDYYRFTLNQNSDVNFGLIGLDPDPAQLQIIADFNNDGIVDNSEIIEEDGINDFSSVTQDRFIITPLPSGTYWARVNTTRENQNTSYTLTAQASIRDGDLQFDPGNTLSTAFGLSSLGVGQILNDTVGSLDRDDYYAFTLTQNSDVRLSLTGLGPDPAQLQIITDLNNDGLVDNDDIIAEDGVNDFSSTTQDRSIVTSLTPGSYWARVVTTRENQNTGYTLSAQAIGRNSDYPIDPGNSLETAVDLGNLGPERTFENVVGSNDRDDYYKFTITQNTEVRLVLTELGNDPAQLQIITDFNNDGLVDSNDIIEDDGVNDFSSTTQDRSIVAPLSAGTYWARVFTTRENQNTGYTLTAQAIGLPGIDNSFEPDDYLASNPDLLLAFGYDLNAATLHYQNFGQAEGRPLDTFPEEQYLASYPDLQAIFGNNTSAATQHYIQFGFSEGRDPLAGFDGAAYIASYDDLINAFGFNPAAGVAHFRTSGIQEGRTITFDPQEYLASYGDLIQAFGYNLAAATQHFITLGQSEGRSRDLFDAAEYVAQYPDLAGFGNDLAAATRHYIQSGFGEGRTVA